MRTTSKAAAERSIQPWHIVVLVIAAVLVLWQVGKMTVGAAKTSDAKVVKDESGGRAGTVATQPGAQAPLSKASPGFMRVLNDKDRDSDN